MRKDILFQPKENGGLNFRVFKAVNLAFLTKQISRLCNRPSSLASRIMKAKYFLQSNIFDDRLGYRPSRFWRSICRVLQVSGYNFQQYLFQGSTLWKGNSDHLDIYTVQAGYQFFRVCNSCDRQPLVGSSNNSRLTNFWKYIWRLNLPAKIKIFVWRLYYYAIPDALSLVKRNSIVSLSCAICNFRCEDFRHVFLECWWARALRSSLEFSVTIFQPQFVCPADWIFAWASQLSVEHSS